MIPDHADVRRRRIAFRAWHRGMREMDLIMGRFADAELVTLSPDDLDAFEALMEMPDPDVYAWISGEAAPPEEIDPAFLNRLRAYHLSLGPRHG